MGDAEKNVGYRGGYAARLSSSNNNRSIPIVCLIVCFACLVFIGIVVAIIIVVLNIDSSDTGRTDCESFDLLGITTDGVYDIKPGGVSEPISVQCVLDTSISDNLYKPSGGGGFTVIHRKVTDGSTSFDVGWTDYVNGFGNSSYDYWLGLDYLAQMTALNNYELHIKLVQTDGTVEWTRYERFSVGGSSFNYVLYVSDYEYSTTSDILQCTAMASALHYSMPFTTSDRNNAPGATSTTSGNCANIYSGGFWYNTNCGSAFLTASTPKYFNCDKYPTNTFSNVLTNFLDGILSTSTSTEYVFELSEVVMMIKRTSRTTFWENHATNTHRSSSYLTLALVAICSTFIKLSL